MGEASVAVSRLRRFIRGLASLAARPGPAALACLLFGLFDALQFRLQTTSSIPPQFFQMLPYLMVIGVLIAVSARKEWRKGWL